MTQRNKCIIQIIISLLFIIGFGGFYIFNLTQMITQDTAYTGNKSITIIKDDIVSKILHNIHSEKIEQAFSLIEQLKNDDNINDEIKSYFSNFEDFCYAIEQEEKTGLFKRGLNSIKQFITQKNDNKALNTAAFMKNSIALENYFGKNSKAEQSIVPYFCIKHHNAKNKKQEQEVAIYKDYIDRFVEGGVSLNKEGANVICLYIYSSYVAKKKDFVPLKNEIEGYFVIYKNNLGDNGDLTIQRKYLSDFQENLRKNPEKKPWLTRNKMYSYPIQNL